MAVMWLWPPKHFGSLRGLCVSSHACPIESCHLPWTMDLVECGTINGLYFLVYQESQPLNDDVFLEVLCVVWWMHGGGICVNFYYLCIVF